MFSLVPFVAILHVERALLLVDARVVVATPLEVLLLLGAEPQHQRCMMHMLHSVVSCAFCAFESGRKPGAVFGRMLFEGGFNKLCAVARIRSRMTCLGAVQKAQNIL